MVEGGEGIGREGRLIWPYMSTGTSEEESQRASKLEGLDLFE